MYSILKQLTEIDEMMTKILENTKVITKKLNIATKALKEIEQCSFSGSYEKDIVDMKTTATNALKQI